MVDRGDLEQLAELSLGLGKAPDAEVRDPERLADRRLRRLALLGLLERNGGLGVQPSSEVVAASSVEVVRGLGHRSSFYPR
jgi:hypothetical protein